MPRTLLLLFFSSTGTHLNLHSFPTRRSSDLESFADFVKRLTRRIEETKAEYLVIDMRLNGGGNTGRCPGRFTRSEEHTSELQSRPQLVCRLLLEKKKYGYCSIRRLRHRR